MSQPSQEARQRTRAFARVMGPFIACATVIVAIRLPDLGGLLDGLFGNAVLPWILGAMMTALGLWFTYVGWISRRPVDNFSAAAS